MVPEFRDSSFALCLTHDVDRPYKTYQGVYDAVTDRSIEEIRSVVDGENPYWQFEEIMNLEADLGVRSAFYFLNEQHLLATSPDNWLSPTNWIQHLGGYDPTDPEVARVIRELDEGGWEVGLHGSYHSCDDRDRLRTEKQTLEQILDKAVRGGRQHYLRRDGFDTWRHHREIGLEYDASLGSGTDYGFDYGYGVLRPFDDEFVVFPTTVMEQALPDPGTEFERAWAECERLLEEAAANDAVMTALWHPRLFNDTEFPGYRELYERLIERALEMDAWVGPPVELYDRLPEPSESHGEVRLPENGRTTGSEPPAMSAND